MADEFAGRTAVITGGSRGIGFGIARHLVRDGARVVITGRAQDALDAAVEELGGPDKALGVAGPAHDVAHQAETFHRAVATFGNVDMLVNNVGLKPPFGPLMEMELESVRAMFETNTLAALSWTQHAYRCWMAEHGGSIVNISSIAARLTTPGLGVYGMTKSMLDHLTRELSIELAPSIRVNGVAPGVVKTDFAAPMFEGREAEVAQTYPLDRLGEPADIARLVAFLLSDGACWITGQVLVADGGFTVRVGA